MALRSRDITRSTPLTARLLTTAVAMASRPQQAAAFYTRREIHGSRLVSVHHVTGRLPTIRHWNRQKSTRSAHIQRLNKSKMFSKVIPMTCYTVKTSIRLRHCHTYTKRRRKLDALRRWLRSATSLFLAINESLQLGMHHSCNLVNVYTKLVYRNMALAANNKTQMVLSHDNSIS